MKQHRTMGRIVIFCILAISIDGSASADEGRDICIAVQRFAVDVAKRMQAGGSADQEFNANGGIDGLSKGALNIINYVHSYRVNKDISAARIGSLTLAKCKNGSFGDLSYVDLPEQYDPAYQQKNKEEETRENEVRATGLPILREQDKGSDSSGSGSNSGNIGSNTNCEMYKQRVKEIDDQMREGYTSVAGDSVREERRKYRELANKHCS